MEADEYVKAYVKANFRKRKLAFAKPRGSTIGELHGEYTLPFATCIQQSGSWKH